MPVAEFFAGFRRSQISVAESADLTFKNCHFLPHRLIDQLLFAPRLMAQAVANCMSLPLTKNPLSPHSSQVAPSCRSTPSS